MKSFHVPLRRDHRHSYQRGQNAGKLPAGELFFEKNFGEHNSYDRIERTKNNRGIETPGLRCADKENASAYVENSGEDHRNETCPGQLKGSSAEHYNPCGDQQRGHARKVRYPQGGAVTCLLNAQKERSEAEASHYRESKSLGL